MDTKILVVGDCIAQFSRDCFFLSFTCVEAGKDGEFHLGALDFSRFILSSAVIAALCEIRTSDYEQHRTDADEYFHHSLTASSELPVWISTLCM